MPLHPRGAFGKCTSHRNVTLTVAIRPKSNQEGRFLLDAGSSEAMSAHLGLRMRVVLLAAAHVRGY